MKTVQSRMTFGNPFEDTAPPRFLTGTGRDNPYFQEGANPGAETEGDPIQRGDVHAKDAARLKIEVTRTRTYKGFTLETVMPFEMWRVKELPELGQFMKEREAQMSIDKHIRSQPEYSDQSQRVGQYLVKRFPNQGCWKIVRNQNYNADRKVQVEERPVPQELSGMFPTLEDATLAIHKYNGEDRS